MLEWYDFAILFILAVPIPLLAVWSYRRFKQQLAAGFEEARLIAYRQAIVTEWFSALAVTGLWLLVGRPAAELGLGFPGGWRFWLAIGLSLAAAVFLTMQAVGVRRNADARAAVRRRLEHVEELVPHNEKELGSFRVLSVTAGICEELVYRGCAMWLLTALGGVWLAVVGSVILFSLAHLYQGPRSIGGILMVGLVMAGLYLLGGALWAPMFLHVAIDLTSGQSSYEVMRPRENQGHNT